MRFKRIRNVKFEDVKLIKFDNSGPVLVLYGRVQGKYHLIANTIDITPNREFVIRTLSKKAYDWETRNLITVDPKKLDL